MNEVLFAVAATLVLQSFWERLAARKVTPQTELERIAVLQQSAAARRAEYAAEKERVLREVSPPSSILSGLLSSSQRQVEEAETAHALALQAWENRQSRQNSR